MVGTLEPRKNHQALLRAYAQLPTELQQKHPIVFAGKPGWKSEQLMDDIADAQKAGQSIIVTGFVDDDLLPALYSNAAVFAFPSIYEGFGMPPLEAMACDTPVVGANTSATKEAIGRAGLTSDPNDIDLLSKNIRRMLEDKPLREHYVALGRAQVQKYTWQKSAQSLKDLLLGGTK